MIGVWSLRSQGLDSVTSPPRALVYGFGIDAHSNTPMGKKIEATRIFAPDLLDSEARRTQPTFTVLSLHKHALPKNTELPQKIQL